MIPVIISSLVSAGANLLAGAVKDKGAEYVKEKFNVDLNEINFDDPAQVQKLKEIEKENESELVKLIFADKTDARDMHIELNKSEDAAWLAKNIVPILAIVVVCLGFGLISLLIFVDIDPSKKDIVIYALGILSAMLAQVVSYFFGSSDQNSNSTNALHKAVGDAMLKATK